MTVEGGHVTPVTHQDVSRRPEADDEDHAIRRRHFRIGIIVIYFISGKHTGLRQGTNFDLRGDIVRCTRCFYTPLASGLQMYL